MKKRWLPAFLIALVALQVIPIPGAVHAESKADIRVKIPTFPVEVNGSIIDNKHAAYPLLMYKDITYFPMTWDYTKALGLAIQWDSVKGLEINKTTPGSWSQDPSGNNDFAKEYQAVLPSYPIAVNGMRIENAQEEYPVFNFRGITYFPMTWRFTHDTFHIDTQWDAMSGLKIGTWKQDNQWNDVQLEVGTRIYGDPLNVHWGVDYTNATVTESGTAFFNKGHTMVFGFTATNIREQRISLNKPVSLELEVRRVPDGVSLYDTGNQEVVWRTTLPGLEGAFDGAGSSKTLRAYWNQKDLNGRQVPTGTYMARLVTPISISYSENGTAQTETVNESDINRGGREITIR
ncbi:hypothetical protein DVH26_35860 [Paenibacillus sp. H1-7]|uniref:hypothetical protein n=1 Tax=Paenibacillus sp. H1-7 TaxID=2282849 RepID=UPI001EF76913|nr:hypothetical protein [Paenibacillus sp. H1-7]ULL19328.1 hypothetical protein DVH26_35860 [Paenibacillus sp. H1-7]